MKIVTNIFAKLLTSRRHSSIQKMFRNYFNKILTYNGISDDYDKQQLNAWVNKWSVFGRKPISEEYTAYRQYSKDNVNLVPNDIARCFIEPVLTPKEYQPFYNDKNSFGIVIPSDMMPKTYFRSINGILYDGEYNPIGNRCFDSLFEDAQKLIVKPSKDMGGHGVSLFTKSDDGYFYDNGKNKLTLEFLLSQYERNFLIQECMKQSTYMSQFNPTSVNTLRIASYRDVKSGEIHILGAVLRIGGKGAFVDNACSGGSFIKVNDDGSLGKYACNQYGQTCEIYNDINFATSTFVIPEYDKIKEFVKIVAKKLPHMSLFANDVAIDETGNPKLIEVNTTDFSYWLYQFNGQSVFGEYTDQVISYCKNKH